jgi:hypothetical protein
MYSGVLVHQTAPNVWEDQATAYTHNIIRPPSNLAPPVINPDQVVVVEPDPDNPTFFRIKGAAGAMQEWTRTVVVDCGFDKSTCTFTKVTEDWTVRGRDLSLVVS